ncbi:MAG: hypothetical protein LBV35_02245 [Acinetobacter sp.]|jgi:hypothetical protein|uniref:hypothetical protein n=1 Tax=Acinetobacter sp. TaxID=472 RepID=UPI0028507CF7|nr:hypothetical protein [Acinetobacter sp.]MDR3027260.1 hypothetical protein [Acinetobacter sp.]
MDNNQLNSKILKIGMWIFSFFFWYLVVAFFLKSNYPIYEQPFNRKEAYEALRDGLTLSAYFLAPAVALVLFSDWRSQHRAISNENEVNQTLIEIRELQNKINSVTFELSFQKNQEIEENMLPHLKRIEEIQAIILTRKAILEFMKDNFTNLTFINNADTILNKQYFLLFYAKNFIGFNEKYNLSENVETLGDRYNSYLLFNNQRNDYSIQSDELLKNLNESAKEYRIT